MYHKKQSKKPSYKFSDFKRACKNKNNIFIYGVAVRHARKYFGLLNEKAILKFIIINGLEKLSFEHTKIWEDNPNKDSPTMVDSYKFESGGKKGYIAFFFSTYTGKWTIKSFKPDKDSNDQMLQALDRAGLIKKLGLEDLR